MIKNKLFAFAMVLVLLLSFSATFAQDCGKEKKTDCKDAQTCSVESMDKNKDGKLFQCPMFCEAPSDSKGKCSKCGMDTKEYTVEDVKTNCQKKCEAEAKECCKKDMDKKECSDKKEVKKDECKDTKKCADTCGSEKVKKESSEQDCSKTKEVKKDDCKETSSCANTCGSDKTKK